MGHVLAVQTWEPGFRRHISVKSGHGSGFLQPQCWRAGTRGAQPISERPCLTNWIERGKRETNSIINCFYFFILYSNCRKLLLLIFNRIHLQQTRYMSHLYSLPYTLCRQTELLIVLFLSTVFRNCIWTDIVSAHPFFPGRVFICLTSISKLLAIMRPSWFVYHYPTNTENCNLSHF